MPNKDVIVFYLKRHLRDLEDRVVPVTHESMAAAGIPYEKRQAMLNAAADRENMFRVEIESFQEAIRIVMESR